MKLNNHGLYDFFVEEKILALYHANTVGTSITFFKNGGLLSRGAVENMKLFQTPQKSDNEDKIFDVWNDIFLDTSDLHTFFRRENRYGPILFELNRELIKNENFEIWITKDNPMYWTENMKMEDKYFQSVDELRKLWNTIDRQKKMITIKNNNSPILFEYVRRVIVDDPRLSIVENDQNIHLFNYAKNRIENVITETHPLRGKFSLRECNTHCWCSINYPKRSINDIKKLFYN